MPNKRKKRPIALAPKPGAMKSRKKARQVTTLFHKLTKERDIALSQNEEAKVQQVDQQLKDMGGREEYQRASQLSTSFHSTSKWILGSLARNGWLYGVSLNSEKKEKKSRRTTRLLEVGAINTELLDAAAETVKDTATNKVKRKYNLHVRAIDIHAMEERIEEHDFLTLPYSSSVVAERYDVVVCSMVLNCVTTPQDRGKMCAKLFHHLRPGGKLFLTIPRSCLFRSAFLTPALFLQMLGENGVGFVIDETKESPRVSFFICHRPEEERTEPLKKVWKKQMIRRKGKKFPNQFSVVLNEKDIFEQE